MKIVQFANSGPIDPAVWSTFGVSVKETADAIGQFGTGLKYAIAVLMREGRNLRISSCGDEYIFGVESASIRGKEFQQITCNGKPLPFTTHLGSKWELWQAYRELYSNCLDEGGDIGIEGDTIIYAEIGDIVHSEVFLQAREPIISTQSCVIYPGESMYLYYKGIRAGNLHLKSRYTYNILDADLTEDRTFKYTFQFERAISNAIFQSDEKDFLRDWATQSKGQFEEDVSFAHCYSTPSTEVMNLAREYRRKGVYFHKGLFDTTIKFLGHDEYEKRDLSATQSKIVKKATDFCAAIGHAIEYPIHLVSDLGDDVLAMANQKTKEIYLSDRVLTQGSKQVASTLVEENIHLKLGLQDCTYNMQSYLFDQIISMGEQLTGEIL